MDAGFHKRHHFSERLGTWGARRPAPYVGSAPGNPFDVSRSFPFVKRPNPVGREWILRTGPVEGLVLAGGLLLLTAWVYARIVQSISLTSSWLLVVAATLLLAIGGFAVRGTVSFAATLPKEIEVVQDAVEASIEIHGPEGTRNVQRRIRFESVEDVKPWRSGGGRWGGGPSPAGIFGKFDSPPDGVVLKLPQTGRDTLIGAGDPYDIIYLAAENYQPVREAWEKWKREKPAETGGYCSLNR